MAESLACPACAKPLRAFNGRLCCDACTGMFLTVGDLASSIEELVHIAAAITFDQDRRSHRACPSCKTAMTACRIHLAMLDETLSPVVKLDRCDAHGVWLDKGELPALFLAVERAFGAHGGGGRSGPPPGGGFGGIQS